MHIDASGGREERLTWLMDAANQHVSILHTADAIYEQVHAADAE